jgi:hypothetical protein
MVAPAIIIEFLIQPSSYRKEHAVHISSIFGSCAILEQWHFFGKPITPHFYETKVYLRLFSIHNISCYADLASTSLFLTTGGMLLGGVADPPAARAAAPRLYLNYLRKKNGTHEIGRTTAEASRLRLRGAP